MQRVTDNQAAVAAKTLVKYREQLREDRRIRKAREQAWPGYQPDIESLIDEPVPNATIATDDLGANMAEELFADEWVHA